MPKEKINKESFEFAYKRLEEILYDLEQNIDEKSLEDLIKNYQEGLKLLKLCRDKLNEAELKIEKINNEK